MKLRGGGLEAKTDTHRETGNEILHQTLEVCKKICSTIEMPVKGREENCREDTLFITSSTSHTQFWVCSWVERPKLHQGFVKGHKRELTQEIRRGKKPNDTRQGRCQPRSLKILQKEEVEQKPKITSLSLKPSPVLKTWSHRLQSSAGEALGFTLTTQASQYWEDWMAWILLLDGEKYIQMDFQKIFYPHCSKWILTNSFLIFQGLDAGQDESSSPSLPGASCCFF